PSAAADRAGASVQIAGDVGSLPVALVPALQNDEQSRRVALGAAADEVVAVDDVDVLELGIVGQHLLNLRRYLGGALQRCAVRQLHAADQIALVLRRYEAVRQVQEQRHGEGDDAGENRE